MECEVQTDTSVIILKRVKAECSLEFLINYNLQLYIKVFHVFLSSLYDENFQETFFFFLKRSVQYSTLFSSISILILHSMIPACCLMQVLLPSEMNE